MNWDTAHEGLRRIRYWAAKHDWESSCSSIEEHKQKQEKNVLLALAKWNEHFFSTNSSEFLCLLFDTYDHAAGIWVSRPFLVHKDEKLKENLAKYFYLLQAYSETIPGVLKLFFLQKGWPHGILTFRFSEDTFEVSKSGVRGLSDYLGEPIPETCITLPAISSKKFYDRIEGFNALFVKDNIAISKGNSQVNSGLLPNAEKTIEEIWGNKLTTAELASKLPEFELEEHNSLRILFANLAWFLDGQSTAESRCAYHYYFYRALPVPAEGGDLDQVYFHQSGQGLLSWASFDEPGCLNGAKGRQAVALTACLTFSRLSDTALPYYERRARFHEAQRGMHDKSCLMWVLDNLVLPVVCGGTLQRNHAGKHLEIAYGPHDLDILPEVPKAVRPILEALFPLESWRQYCDKREDQLRYLLELIQPLRAEGSPIEAERALLVVCHNLDKIPSGATIEARESDKRLLLAAQTDLANGGAIFIPASKALERVDRAFGSSDTLEVRKQKLAEALEGLKREAADLGKLSSLQQLMLRGEDEGGWKSNEGLICSLSVPTPCGKATRNLPFPKVNLPFYLSDLHLAFQHLRANWRKYSPQSGAKFRVCVLPNWFVIVWSQQGWAETYASWIDKVRISLKKEFKTSRGLPLVLRFAAQHNAKCVWVRTMDTKRTPVMGDVQMLKQILTETCETCPLREADSGEHELGIAFSMEDYYV